MDSHPYYQALTPFAWFENQFGPRPDLFCKLCGEMCVSSDAFVAHIMFHRSSVIVSFHSEKKVVVIESSYVKQNEQYFFNQNVVNLNNQFGGVAAPQFPALLPSSISHLIEPKSEEQAVRVVLDGSKTLNSFPTQLVRTI